MADGGYNGRKEKDDNLALALAVGEILSDSGVEVGFTRVEDVYQSPVDKARNANRQDGDFLVSIHRNSSTSPSATGVEMWVHSSNPTDDNLLAQNILDCFDTLEIMKNRGIYTGYRDGKDMNYYINRNTKMPSVLAEIGFISSKDDNKKYDENIEKYAKAIADGIEMTLKEMNGE